MGTLLDLIFDNLFFVIIVVGGILNFISRMSKGETKQRQPKKKPFLDDLGDVFKEILPFDEDEEEGKQKQQQKQSTAAVPVEEVPYVSEFEKKRRELEQLERRERAAFRRVQTINEATQSPLATRNKGLTFNVKEIGKEEIVKGVIWSEVLGRPMALKRHSRFTHRSR